MGVIPERKEYKNFTYERYMSLSDKSLQLGFKKITHTPYSEKSHFDKTGLLYDNKKVVLVYDVKAKMLTITAQEKAIKHLSTLIDSKKEEVKKADKKADFKQEQAPKQNKKEKKGKEKKKDLLLDLGLKKDKKDKKKQSEKQEKVNKAKEQAKQSKKKDKKKLAKEKAYQNSSAQNKAFEKPISIDKKIVEEQKGRNGIYSVIKDYYPLSFARAMHKIRNDEQVKINTLRSNQSKSGVENRYHVIVGDKQCEISYLQDEGTLDISGECTDLVKDKFLQEGGVEVYASHSQAKEDDYVIVLKSKMPSALSFLSVEQKNDLASGMRELEKAVDHYEYSMFLLSPFKGLENFIFDLLKTKNITVKKIGQAFDKNDKGAYVLKDAYKNKCGIVYGEVMASLYEEYFALHNHYAHADIKGLHNIGSKKDAIAVVNRIYKNIEYNCKKLTEINFKIIR